MKDQPRLSRRSVLVTVAGGAVLGAVWGAAFPIVASESRPSMAIVGQRAGQLVLIDSGKARALVFLGEPEDVLIERIPSMMTLFRQRIDIMVGSRTMLERYATRLDGRWATRQAIMLNGSIQTPALAMPTTVVPEAAHVNLGDGMSMECTVEYRGAWRAGHESDEPLWMTRIVHPAGEVTLLPDERSLEAFGPVQTALLVMPDMASGTLGARAQIRAAAVNHDSELAEADVEPTAPLTRIYPQDIARFAFGDDGIELPPWTRTGNTR